MSPVTEPWTEGFEPRFLIGERVVRATYHPSGLERFDSVFVKGGIGDGNWFVKDSDARVGWEATTEQIYKSYVPISQDALDELEQALEETDAVPPTQISFVEQDGSFYVDLGGESGD